VNALQQAIYDLIEQFVQRQRIPCEVIKQYRPHLIDEITPHSVSLRDSHKGFWGESNEWKYSLYGGGCRVTHVETQETIGWDAPDLLRFDRYWFVDWVHWYLKYNSQDKIALPLLFLVIDKSVEDRERDTFEILNQLYRLNKLEYNPERTNKYKLTLPLVSSISR
jgi:hypothetical protein